MIPAALSIFYDHRQAADPREKAEGLQDQMRCDHRRRLNAGKAKLIQRGKADAEAEGKRPGNDIFQRKKRQLGKKHVHAAQHSENHRDPYIAQKSGKQGIQDEKEKQRAQKPIMGYRGFPQIQDFLGRMGKIRARDHLVDQGIQDGKHEIGNAQIHRFMQDEAPPCFLPLPFSCEMVYKAAQKHKKRHMEGPNKVL